MGRYIEPKKEKRVRRLLRRGLGQREIGRRVGVSHTTVRAVGGRQRRFSLEIVFRRAKPYRCPQKHLVNLVPCPICLALEARRLASDPPRPRPRRVS
jgi:transposase